MDEQLFFVGSYTQPFFDVNGQGEGIYRCKLNLTTGALSKSGLTAGVTNPSYLTVSGRHLYAVQECLANKEPAVYAYTLRAGDGQLEPLNRQPVAGELPCHLSVDRGGRRLAVANYGSGSVAVYPLDKDGRVGACSDTAVHQGRSVHPSRQTAPHAHAAVLGPDGETLFVPDLGLDEVKSYRLDPSRGRLIAYEVTRFAPGSGPRHLSFHPSGRYAFVINELASTVTAFRHTKGRLTPVAEVSTLPDEAAEKSYAAALHLAPSGCFLYASNRGHDSITVLAFDAASGDLARVQNVPTRGRTPRDFRFEPGGHLLVVANQDSNVLMSFWVDAVSGELRPTGHHLPIRTPTCVAMAM